MIAHVLAAVLSAAEPATTTVHVESPIELGFFQLLDETRELQRNPVLSTITTHRSGKPMCVAPCTVDVRRDPNAKFFFAAPGTPMTSTFSLGDRAEVNVRVKPADATWRSVAQASGVAALLFIGLGTIGIVDGVLTKRGLPLGIGATGATLGVGLGALSIVAWFLLGTTRVEVW